MYSGNSVTTTDPAGKWTTLERDAFGNVTKLIEPNPAGGGNLETAYNYHLAGQITSAVMTRGAVTQTRTWVYNVTTLRLTTETHPESRMFSGHIGPPRRRRCDGRRMPRSRSNRGE